ncbi:hypothetical protein BV20DRAFT_198542 [Pilatotrama ljubarskyi]|nr:hypothetical protein BV20DRAFT_198542 [Pilatotrama ljubarskyi]
MAKKKTPATVVCWQCKKSFKGEAACQDHATAKRHQWRASVTVQAVVPASSKITAPAKRIKTASQPASTCSKKVVSSSSTTRLCSAAIESSSRPPISLPTEKDWSCPACLKSFKGPMAVHLHYSDVHHQLLEPTTTYSAPCQTYVFKSPVHYTNSPNHPKYPACHTGFADEAELRQHQLAENMCDVCEQQYPSAAILRAHRETGSCSRCFTLVATSASVPVLQSPAGSSIAVPEYDLSLSVSSPNPKDGASRQHIPPSTIHANPDDSNPQTAMGEAKGPGRLARAMIPPAALQRQRRL